MGPLFATLLMLLLAVCTQVTADPPACLDLLCTKHCPGGYTVDTNGCQTCQCRKKCKNVKQCGDDEFCNGDCCPNAVMTQRCIDLCPTTTCFGSNTCEMYCNCFASCLPP